MGEVVQIVSQRAAEDSWESYRVHTARLIDDPKLLLDRDFMEEKRRLERTWLRIFDRMDG